MIPIGNLELGHLNDTLSYLATVTGCWHPLTTRAVISEIKHVRFFETLLWTRDMCHGASDGTA